MKGGPCGVLAAVQAEMLRHLLDYSSFDDNNNEKDNDNENYHDVQQDYKEKVKLKNAANKEVVEEVDTLEESRKALALAIGTVLARASVAGLDANTLNSGSPPETLILIPNKAPYH